MVIITIVYIYIGLLLLGINHINLWYKLIMFIVVFFNQQTSLEGGNHLESQLYVWRLNKTYSN